MRIKRRSRRGGGCGGGGGRAGRGVVSTIDGDGFQMISAVVDESRRSNALSRAGVPMSQSTKTERRRGDRHRQRLPPPRLHGFLAAQSAASGNGSRFRLMRFYVCRCCRRLHQPISSGAALPCLLSLPGALPAETAGEDERDHRHRGWTLRPRRAARLRGRRLRGGGGFAAAGHDRYSLGPTSHGGTRRGENAIKNMLGGGGGNAGMFRKVVRRTTRLLKSRRARPTEWCSSRKSVPQTPRDEHPILITASALDDDFLCSSRRPGPLSLATPGLDSSKLTRP